MKRNAYKLTDLPNGQVIVTIHSEFHKDTMQKLLDGELLGCKIDSVATETVEYITKATYIVTRPTVKGDDLSPAELADLLIIKGLEGFVNRAIDLFRSDIDCQCACGHYNVYTEGERKIVVENTETKEGVVWDLSK